MFRLSEAMHSQIHTRTQMKVKLYSHVLLTYCMYFLSKILLCYLLNNLFCTRTHTHIICIYCGKVITTTSYIPSRYQCYPICVCNHTCQTCDGMHVVHRFQFSALISPMNIRLNGDTAENENKNETPKKERTKRGISTF